MPSIVFLKRMSAAVWNNFLFMVLGGKVAKYHKHRRFPCSRCKRHGIQENIVYNVITITMIERRHGMFIIEDEIHAEPQTGNYATFAAALEEIRRRSRLAWNIAPNRAPCMSWETCGRIYAIVQYDTAVQPWQEVQRRTVLEIDARGATWVSGFDTS